MVVRVVRLGTARAADEGVRIGTVRRPPRGVPKAEFAAQNWYDVWFPVLAPSAETMKLGQLARTPGAWAAFARKYRAEMARPESAHALQLLASLSHRTHFSVGCYCAQEAHCHRSILRALLAEQGAALDDRGAGGGEDAPTPGRPAIGTPRVPSSGRATPGATAEVAAEGGCTCGHVRYRMASRPLFVHCCHCRWCQRETGASFALNAMIEADRVTTLAAPPEPVDTPSASGMGQRIFRCPRCRVAVWSHYGAAGPLIDFVRVGTLDRPDQWPPDIHIYTASKQPWVNLPAGVPAVPGYYEREHHWPADSLARRQALLPRIEAYRAGLRQGPPVGARATRLHGGASSAPGGEGQGPAPST